MKVFLISTRNHANASGEYNLEDGSLTVLQGSIVSPSISDSKTFRGKKAIEKARQGIVFDNKLQRDIRFKSPSTAANFVTGSSSNGNRLWKTVDGRQLGDLLKGGVKNG